MHCPKTDYSKAKIKGSAAATRHQLRPSHQRIIGPLASRREMQIGPRQRRKQKTTKFQQFLLLLLRVMQIWQKKNRPSVVNSLAHIGYSVPTRHRSSRGPSIPFSSPFCFPSVPRENLKSIGLSYLICIFPLFFFSFSGHYFQNKCVISISFF